MLAIGLLLAMTACSGGSDSTGAGSDDEPTAPAAAATAPQEPTAASSPEPEDDVTPEPGATPPPSEPDAESAAVVETARAWIDQAADLPTSMGASLEYEEVDRAGNVSHVRFSQAYDGYRVEGGELIVHVLGDGSVQGATSSLSHADPTPNAAPNTTADEAIAVADKAVTGTVQPGVETETVWVEDGTTLRLAIRVDFATTAPLGSWTVFVDAADGSIIGTERVEERARPTSPGLRGSSTAAGSGVPKAAFAQSSDRCDLPPAPAACVFVPDPIYAAGGTLSSTAAANDFLTGVRLQGLDDPSSGALVGEFANLEPSGAPIDPVPQPDGLWGAGRGDSGFEAQNTYYWIDYGQRVVQRLGFDDVVNESFPVVPIDPDTVDNAFYSPFERRIYMGVGSNGIHEGEDATGILHEYGHALLDDINPNLLSNGDIGAYHESFGDIFAALTTIEFRTGDWACFFLWTDQACLRRMDTDKVYPDDLVRQIHDDGEIYSGAIFDIFAGLLAQDGIDIDDCPGSSACNETRDRVLTTVLASNFYLTENMSMPDIAGSFIRANDAQYAGADAALIEQAFEARGLQGGSGTLLDGGGVRNGATAAVAVELDIAHSFRGDLRVVAGVTDAAFDDLCTPIVLFEPDERDDEHDLSGRIDISDSDCAPFAPPGPDRIWYLLVEDTLADDEGEILSFRLIAEGTSHLAPGLPLPIADADPTGTVALIDGSTEPMAPESMSGFGSADPGTLFATATLTHAYHGDLSIRAGVVDEESTILCSVPVLEPEPADDSSGTLGGDVAMDRCAEFYPPGPDRQWFLQVTDNAAEDVGTVDRFSVTGPDGEVFDFADVPVDIPDADVDGIALLLDDSGGSSGQAGGGGQGADVALPAVSIAITHPYAGDIAITGGVVDADDGVLCEVTIATPDGNNDAVDPAGDVSLAACARYFPPEPDQRWFLFVADTLSADVGTVDGFSLTGPDGAVFTFEDVPIDIPDADPDGVVLYLDGSELGFGASTDPVVNLVISHPYVGDLDLRVGVVDGDGDTLCETIVAEADFDNDAVDLAIDVPLGECGEFYPPAPDRQWFVEAVDNFEFDRGTIDAFALYGPDGRVWRHDDGAVRIPDEDPDGIVLYLDGSGGVLEGGARSSPVASVEIEHPYRGDLTVTVGVVDEEDTILCEQVLLEADVGDTGRDVSLEVSLSACAEFSPLADGTAWFLLVVDEQAEDTGTIERFTVSGRDGSFEFDGDPVRIPDDAPDGVALLIS